MTTSGDDDNNNGEEEDCWDAFGSDDDDDDDNDNKDDVHGDTAKDYNIVVDDNNNKDSPKDGQNSGISINENDASKAASAIASYLSQTFLRHNAQVPLSYRRVLVIPSSNVRLCQIMKKALEQRDMMVITFDTSCHGGIIESDGQPIVELFDAVIVLDESVHNMVGSWIVKMTQNLCHGGTLIVSESLLMDTKELQDQFFLPPSHEMNTSRQICKIRMGNSGTTDNMDSAISSTLSFVARTKKSVQVHTSTCPWLPSSHSVVAEEERLHQATVTISSHESSTSAMTDVSIQKAVHHLNQYGYCIIRNLLNVTECQAWGKAVLDSVHDAAKILLERDGVDIYNPQSSTFEPQSYQELSMREDLRLDIRQGPALTTIRTNRGDEEKGNQSIVLSASEHDYMGGIFLRGHPNLLEIVRRTMNPKDGRNNELYTGNIGRYNFSGSGPDGSYQDMRLSPVGGIVSLPGAADQALHADTPHLFEHIPDLPAHYVNIFAPAVPFDDKVGGTAFVHGSHNLAFTARYCGGTNVDNSKVYPFLVRPSLSVGDVVLFDCRMLHFGLANTSTSIERCICYTNTWHNWFHDAKNWDMNRRIFE